MKIKLFFSLVSDFIFLSLLNNNEILINLQKYNFRQHSENFFLYLNKSLKQSQILLTDVQEIYFTNFPGSQTGIRISLAFILTLQTLNPKIKIYHLNSLFLQAGEKENIISLISIDLKKTKYYCAVYQNTKCLFEPQIIEVEKLNKIKNSFSNFTIKEDFKQVDFLSSFQKLLKFFKPFEFSNKQVAF